MPHNGLQQILRTAALVAALDLAMLAAGSALAGRTPLAAGGLLAPPTMVLAATAAAGAWALALGVGWRRLVAGALLGAAAALAAGWVLIPGLAPHVGRYPGALADVVRQGLLVVVTAAAGVFVLPLLDPRLRRTGPAPHPARTAAAATVLAAVLAGIEVQVTGGFDGLLTLVSGSVTALVLAAAGLLLSVAGGERIGAAVGGAAILLWFGVNLIWLAAGAPWFP